MAGSAAWLSITLIALALGVARESAAQSPASPTAPVNEPFQFKLPSLQRAQGRPPLLQPVPPRVIPPLAEATLAVEGLRFAGFSPDGKTVCVGSSHGDYTRLAATDLALLDRPETLPPLGVASSAVTRDHSRFAIGGWSGDMLVLDAGTSQITAQLPVPFDLDRTAVTAIALSEDASKCVVGNRSSIIRMYQVASSEVLWQSEPLQQEISGVAVSQDGKHVAVSTGVLSDYRAPGKIVVLDAANGKVRHRWLDTTGKINHVAIGPDSKTLLAADNSAARVYDLDSGKLVSENPALSGAQRFKFIDGTRCVVSLFPGRLAIWDIATNQVTVRYTGHKKPADGGPVQLVWALDISPDGKTLLTADTVGQVYLWPIPAK